MAHVSLRVSEQEKSLMESYAGLHGVSLSDAIKEVFFEKLEDEYDVRAIADYEANPPEKTYSMAEVAKELGIEDVL